MRATTKIRSVAGSRWAAVIVTAGLCAGAFGGTHVTADDIGERTVFVPTEPCRLLDTRPSQIGPGETLDVSAEPGVTRCPIPPGAKALSLNVTAIDATEPTNLRFFPTGGDVPLTANLNPRPGAPVSNSVTVGIDPDNLHFSIFNRFGSVAVVVDMMGYYGSLGLSRYTYSYDEVDALLETKLDTDRADNRFTSGYRVESTLRGVATWSAGTTRDVSVACPAGMHPTGGGGGADVTGVALVSSFPVPVGSQRPTGWMATFRNVTDGVLTAKSIEAFVVCADPGRGVG